MPVPQPFVLHESNYKQQLDYRPNLAVLPWGATEAHNYHLPHGTDVIQAVELAREAAKLAHERGAKPVVLPAIPFGNNAQQLDQVATIHCSTATSLAILRDVAYSLTQQGIDRLLILNGHGGNEFKPHVRDVQHEFHMLIVVQNFWAAAADVAEQLFEEEGDHANEMETSLMLHLCPEWVQLDQAGPGKRVPFALQSIAKTGAWTPRPWSKVHPDTGSGNPMKATAAKGQAYFAAISEAIAELLCELSAAQPGDLPYRPDQA